jgi:hypothetical protein
MISPLSLLTRLPGRSGCDNTNRVNPAVLAICQRDTGRFSMDDLIANRLEQRLGRLHAKQRLGIEKDHEAQIFGQGINFFHIENWFSIHSLIRNALKLSGIFWRGQRNAEHVQVRHNHIRMQRLPPAFNGLTLLHISDLHVDMNAGAMRRLEQPPPGFGIRHLRHNRRLSGRDIRTVRCCA